MLKCFHSLLFPKLCWHIRLSPIYIVFLFYSMSSNRDEVKLNGICEKMGGVAEVLKYSMSGMRATSEIQSCMEVCLILQHYSSLWKLRLHLIYRNYHHYL